MKTIIAGSRTGFTFEAIMIGMMLAEQSGIVPTEIVSGRAHGVDAFGERWASQHDLPITPFPADWDFHGKKAGILRNIEMAKYADAAVIFWNGRSKGTRHMVLEAGKHDLALLVFSEKGMKRYI